MNPDIANGIVFLVACILLVLWMADAAYAHELRNEQRREK